MQLSQSLHIICLTAGVQQTFGRAQPVYVSGGGGGGGRAGGDAGARDDNAPCNTLFVGNLADTVDENEMRNLFAGAPVRPSGVSRDIL